MLFRVHIHLQSTSNIVINNLQYSTSETLLKERSVIYENQVYCSVKKIITLVPVLRNVSPFHTLSLTFFNICSDIKHIFVFKFMNSTLSSLKVLQAKLDFHEFWNACHYFTKILVLDFISLGICWKNIYIKIYVQCLDALF